MKKIFIIALSVILLIGVFSACSNNGDTSSNREIAEKYALSEAEKDGHNTEKDSSSSARFDFKYAKLKNSKYVEPNYVVEVEVNIETTLSYGGSSFTTDTHNILKYTINVSDGKAKLINREIIKD